MRPLAIVGWTLTAGLMACAGAPPPGATSSGATSASGSGSETAAPNDSGRGTAPDPLGSAAVEALLEAADEGPPAPPLPPPGGPPTHLWGAVGLTKIYEKPDRDARIIGAIRAGQAVRLRGTQAVTAQKLYQCEEGWYPIQPRGFACVGGPGHATLQGDDPRVVAARLALPDSREAYPFRFGVSVGAPKYRRIPTGPEQRQAEPGLDQYLAHLPKADPTQGGAIDTNRAGKGPPPALSRFFSQVKPPLVDDKAAFEGMKVAWRREFDAAGRTWLLTPDLTLVPKDKVRVKPLPQLRGVDLRNEPDRQLPLAFTWLDDAPTFRRGERSELEPTGRSLPRHAFAPATGNMAEGKGGYYWEMRDGTFVFYPNVTILKPAPFRPKGVGPGDKWVYVRITWGYLLAYEGDTPIYAAAISPGVDGISPRAHATMTGIHTIGWKMLSADMDGKDKGKYWFVDEVPWVQYYEDSFALHGAWWHDDFGRPKSHGCINLSPYDARSLFRWMDPQLPEGWYAATSYYPHVKGTVVQIRH